MNKFRGLKNQNDFKGLAEGMRNENSSQAKFFRSQAKYSASQAKYSLRGQRKASLRRCPNTSATLPSCMSPDRVRGGRGGGGGIAGFNCFWASPNSLLSRINSL